MYRFSSRSLALSVALTAGLGACVLDGELSTDEDFLEDEEEVGAAYSSTSTVAWRELPGLADVVQIDLTRNLDGSLALFARTKDGGMRTVRKLAGDQWSAVQSLDGWALQRFVTATNADGRLEVFALGGDGAIYHRWQTAPSSATWSGWAYLGGSSLKDLTVARNLDGRLQLLALGGDDYVYSRAQVSANGGFGDWFWVGGPGVRSVASAAHASGRLTLVGIDPWGELMLTSQPTANGLFKGWTTLGGSLARVSLARNVDGRLAIAGLGKNERIYLETQTAPDLGFGDWADRGAGGVKDMDWAMGPDGALHLFLVGSDGGIHHSRQSSAGAEHIWKLGLGGKSLTRVAAEPNPDGRLEVVGLGADGKVYFARETQPGHWLQLPYPPQIDALMFSPAQPKVGDTVEVSWSVSPDSGCTLYARLNLDPGGQTTTIGNWQGVTSGKASFTIAKSTTARLVTGCHEGEPSGRTIASNRDVWIEATPAPSTPTPTPTPPGTTTATYRQYLAREQVTGPIPYSFWFGVGIWQGKLKGLKNPNLYAMSLIKWSGSNNDCWKENAVTLYAGQSASAADLQKLYGSATPALPLGIRACVSVDLPGFAEIDVTYEYVP